MGVVSSRGARKTRVNMLLCRVSCVGILARSSCTLSMQIMSVGRQVFFPTNCDFLSAVTTSRVTTTTILVGLYSRSFTFL